MGSLRWFWLALLINEERLIAGHCIRPIAMLQWMECQDYQNDVGSLWSIVGVGR